MPTPSFATDVVRALYRLEPVSVEGLDQHQYDGRAIYRIREAQGGIWVLRLKRGAEEHQALTHTAQVLEWLAQRGYSAPAVRRTHDQRLVGMADGWAIALLSYVEGSVLGMTSAADFGIFAQAVGRLHSLRADVTPGFAPSRCHPENIGIAAERLERHRAKLPPEFQPLAADLHALAAPHLE